MFPRLKNYKSNGKEYEYLVVSESRRSKNGVSTTHDMATLGSTKKIGKEEVEKLINGLARLFEIDTCKTSNDIKVIESLEHGNIILWKHFWDKLDLGKVIDKYISKEKSRVSIDVSKYIEMMVVSRNSNPLSKLGTTRWKSTTSYKYMHGYSELKNEVEYYYRSMDYLLESKNEIELAIFEKLKNLFSINVKMTFYDITSTYFHSNQCPLSELGYSRDSRSDLEQIVIGVVTSEEGYPIKHYVFSGNTKDETTVGKVVKELKDKFNIEETTFVGDRGMITKLNLEKIIKEDFNYIMGVKFRQDEIMEMLFDDDSNLVDHYEQYKQLDIQERILKIKDFIIWKVEEILRNENVNYKKTDMGKLKTFVLQLTNKSIIKGPNLSSLLEDLTCNKPKIKRKISYLINKYETKYEDTRRVVICLNKERKSTGQRKRDKKITNLSKQLKDIIRINEGKSNEGQKSITLEKKIIELFSGYKKQYKKFFNLDDIIVNKTNNVILNDRIILEEEKRDGIFIINTNLTEIDISKEKVIDSYKNLREVEDLFDDFKNFVDVNPVRHWKEKRVRSHVFICILSLLLKRIFEIDCYKGKGIMIALEEMSKLKFMKCQINNYNPTMEKVSSFKTVTVPTSTQMKLFKMAGIKNPTNITKFL